MGEDIKEMSIPLTDSDQQQKQNQPSQPKRELLNVAAPWADAFSKAVAGIAIALYASGFLAVSLYHSKFGFVGTNPFRPRVLAAGAWFFLFTAVPASIAATFRLESWRYAARNAATVWVACFTLSALIGGILFDYTNPRSFIHLPTWVWITLAVLWIGSVALTTPEYKIPESVVITASILLTLLYMLNPLVAFARQEFDISCLTLWFFGVSVAALMEFKVRNRENLGSFAGWVKPLAVLFAALLVFSQYVYPHLKASWGGGTLTDVTICFTKDSFLYPSKSVQAKLIEESDEGFYIVGSKESKALFVPRSAVGMIYFSDKLTESPLLQNNKP